jgi:hypothetical protein
VLLYGKDNAQKWLTNNVPIPSFFLSRFILTDYQIKKTRKTLQKGIITTVANKLHEIKATIKYQLSQAIDNEIQKLSIISIS